ncbi:syndecan-1 [Lepisosteus oculatus]|uniref:syndecan-1 n=1 Tax=Lepisosteus oculatus TaxID=7918 RepID=UPI0035F4FFD0
MRMHNTAVLLLCLGLWIPVALSNSIPPEDLDGSSDDEDFSGSGDGTVFDTPTSSEDELHLNVTATPVVLKTTESPKLHEAEEQRTTSLAPVSSSKVTTTPVSTASPDTTVMPQIPVQEPTSAKPETTTRDVASPPIVDVATSAPSAADTPRGSTTAEMDFPHSEDLEPTTAAHSSSATLPSDDQSADPFVKGTSVVTVAAPSQPPTTAGAEDVTFREDSVLSSTIPVHTTQPSIELIPENEIHPNPRMVNTEIHSILATIKPEKPIEKVDSDIYFAEERPLDSETSEQAASEGLLENKEVLAGVIAGGIIGLAFAVLLVALMVYRMKKKDEGSYALDEQKHSNGGYQKPQKQEEFLA